LYIVSDAVYGTAPFIPASNEENSHACMDILAKSND